jgi:PAS domain S-box-containing protein
MRVVQSIRILLVEDEVGDAHLVKMALKPHQDIHFEVTWVESILLAKQTLINSIFDVLILDLSLPGSTGLETLKIAQEIVGEIPIIVLTGYDDIDFALNILQQGACDYIVKGNFDSLARVIRYALLDAELKISNQKLDAANLSLDLLNSLNKVAIFYETDLKGCITLVNEQFCCVSGYSEKELIGFNINLINSKTHTDDFFFHMWQTINKGNSWSGEICNRNKEGENYWVHTTILPIFCGNSETNHYKYAVIGFDITERKKLEVTLQSRALLYKAAIETTDGFCRISNNGNFLEVSDGYCELSGYSREELLTMNVLNMKGSFTLGLQQFSQLLQENGKTFEIELYRKDHSKWLAEMTISYSSLHDGSLFIFLHDITERIKMQQRDKMLREQIAHMQKMDSIGQMTSGIAHDFNNILTVILGFSTLAIHFNQQNDTESAIPCLENVQVAANRAVDLVKKMLVFCREDIAQAITPINPSKIVEEVAGISDLLRSGISTEISLQLINMLNNESAAILIDPTALHQVVTNLIVNARDAIGSSQHKSGLITVSLFHDSVTNNDTFCSCCGKKLEGKFISIGISDTGTGISVDKIKHIFDPFFTTKEVGKGTGLGLSVVSGIVHDSEGHIIVDSTLGVGTTFYLLFPPSREETKNDSDDLLTSTSNENDAKLNLKICVIDDDSDICSLFSQELRLLGYAVESFNSSLVAWENFQNKPNYFDVILTDYSMPHATGLDLAKYMLVLRPELLIFICTGSAAKVSNLDLPTGNVFLLKKPILMTVIDEMIKKNFNSKK